MNHYEDVEILLVEDNQTDAELTIRCLKQNKLASKLVWVKDGAEAVDFLFANGNYSSRDAANVPKVVFLDLRLPKMDGLEVLQSIRSEERTSFIPVVIMTSSNNEKDIVESYRLGVNSYVTKPVEYDDFAKTITKLGIYWLMMNRCPGNKCT